MAYADIFEGKDLRICPRELLGRLWLHLLQDGFPFETMLPRQAEVQPRPGRSQDQA